MSVVLVYVLFIAAGIAAGGAYSMWKFNKLASGVLLALAVLAAAAGMPRVRSRPRRDSTATGTTST